MVQKFISYGACKSRDIFQQKNQEVSKVRPYLKDGITFKTKTENVDENVVNFVKINILNF